MTHGAGLRALWPALAVLALGCLITWGAWHNEVTREATLDQAHTDAQVQEYTHAIRSRMAGYEQILRGGTSLFSSMPNVTRNQWRDYVANLEVQDNYPGFQGIGYAAHVSQADKAAFIAQQRAQGLAQYDIRPPGDRPAYVPVTYLEPQSERNLRAHGFDMMSEPLRAAAMAQARDSGQPAITAKLKLASEAAQSVNFGFLLYIPVYRTGAHIDSVEGRQAALKGFVNSPFRMVDLLKGALGNHTAHVTLNIYDGPKPSPDNLMYSGGPGMAKGPQAADAAPVRLLPPVPLAIHGRVWLLEFGLPGDPARARDAQGRLILLAGGIISCLLATLAWAAQARIRHMHQSAQHYYQLANYDTLTTLSNRTLFQARLQAALDGHTTPDKPLALLFIDLDQFKDVNDTLGHHWGDKVLQEVAARLRSGVGRDEAIARLGGDEFAVILDHIGSADEAGTLAQHLIDALAQPYQLEGESYVVTASIGITLFPQDAGNATDLLKCADHAMHAAKRVGRNRSMFYSPAMLDGSQHRLRMISDLRTAVAHNELFVVYQPIVDMATQRICKAEALLRWRSPKHGLVNPGDFIPMAEEAGLIGALGDWVFNEVKNQVLTWRQTLSPDLQVSINVSPAQFKRPDGDLHQWIATLQAAGLPGQAIGLEITEGLLLDMNPSVTKQLLSLRDAGIPVALDDFGTGYSSLSYLRKLDIDYLKIDQTFVSALQPGSDALVLCEAIIVMAHKLGLGVVAEGVETVEQRNLLVAAGCDFGQGYLFSRPVEPAAFEAMFKAT